MRPIAQFQSKPAGGFTLLEMLTATAVLILLIALLAPIFSSLTSTASNSSEKMDVDLMARQALDRIGRDLALMPLREDLDYFLNKADGNDEFSFFSSVPGVLPGAGGPAGDPASGISLVGYRVLDGRLERMAVAQTFDDLTFLTYDNAGDLIPATGITRALAAVTDTDFHTHCEGVFRFELGFLLKDGSFATLPMDTGKNPSNPSAPGLREWSPAPHRFARVRVSDGPSNTVFRSLGWQDVAAVVVTLAVVDPANKVAADGVASAGSQLVDAAPSTNPATPNLPATAWLNALGGSGIPQSTRNAIRVYQRAFYLNSR